MFQVTQIVRGGGVRTQIPGSLDKAHGLGPCALTGSPWASLSSSVYIKSYHKCIKNNMGTDHNSWREQRQKEMRKSQCGSM